MVEAISKREPPSNVKEIQQFIGSCNYYRRFIKGISEIAAPLTKLLKSDEPWEWKEAQMRAFNELKRALVSYPIMRQPDFRREFIIFTDASNYAIGAVLSQKDEENREYVIAYRSKKMNKAELNYTITEKECVAVVWPVKQFRNYLYGVEFTIVTDHSALAWLMNIKEPVGRLARWALYLQTYSFTMIHRAGRIHNNADTLSRPPMKIPAHHLRAL